MAKSPGTTWPLGAHPHRVPGLFPSVLVGLLLVACNGGVEGPASARDDGSNANGVAPFEPAEPVLARLTEAQYRNAMRDLFGEPLPAFPLEPDTQPHLFSTVGATSTSISENGVSQWEDAAALVTATVFFDAARRSALVGCEPVSAGDECTRAFLERFGYRAWRRPLEKDELTRYVDVARRTGAGGDPWGGLRYALTGLLQSPNFVYRVEVGEPDDEHPGWYRYTGHEMASRLSFLLWNTIPDEELLRAARDGELVTEEGIQAQAERMLLDVERSRQAFRPFVTEYFGLAALQHLARSPELFPQFTATLGAAMRAELEHLVDDLVFVEDGDLTDIFTTRKAYVNSELAALYDLTVPEAVDANTWVAVDLPEAGPRAGLMTTAAVLTLAAHPDRTSPTRRGQYVRQRLLGEHVEQPPQDEPLELEKEGIDPNATLREKLAAHRDNPKCASCHAAIDPIGLGLEDFDAIGKYRTMEGDQPVDARGEIEGVEFEGGRELGAILGSDPRIARTVVKQFYRHATGRMETEGERGALLELAETFTQDGHRISRLLVRLVSHQAYRFLRPPPALTDETPLEEGEGPEASP